MTRISDYCLRFGVLAGLAGMGLGIAMAASHDHSQMPLHAHVNLLGWVSMVLYGLVYRVIPAAGASALARWQFLMAAAGIIVMVPGLGFIGAGNQEMGEPFAVVGSLLTIAAMVLFVTVVFRATGSAAARPAIQPAE
ncbi:MAG TPA: hypothetical protein VEH84_12270 [Alphaproteobacteria bacterium]|nr:hypothetical protein [Alphaproteobacteria bacterium]